MTAMRPHVMALVRRNLIRSSPIISFSMGRGDGIASDTIRYTVIQTGGELGLGLADNRPTAGTMKRFGFNKDLSCKSGTGAQQHDCQ